ncbi:hypothetical protein KIS1582_3598 [Cytobacillus firmus]|uniref:Uncharacterized protein n=1 Tax=Cytobacillus firmus TaxID=1399 RepID=A0A800N9D6_CYTFI|nr:hypothetical protein KIS1582_3598 [Cytobacillus firmus]
MIFGSGTGHRLSPYAGSLWNSIPVLLFSSAIYYLKIIYQISLDKSIFFVN